MKVYSFNDNGMYTGQREAREDPKEPGRFLIPRNSTTVVPSSAIQGKAKIGIWDGLQWHESNHPPAAPQEDMTPTVRRRIIKDKIRNNTATLGQVFAYDGRNYLFTDLVWEQLRETKDLIDLSTGNIFPREIVVGVDDDGDEITETFGQMGEFIQFARAAIEHLTNVKTGGRAIIIAFNLTPDADVPMPDLWTDPRFE